MRCNNEPSIELNNLDRNTRPMTYFLARLGGLLFPGGASALRLGAGSAATFG